MKSDNKPVFKVSYGASDSSVVNLTNNALSIQGHNFQSGQELILDKQGGDGIGIGTTSHVTGTKDIVMSVVTSGTGSSAMYENGYNIQIPGPVTGIAVTENPPGPAFRFYGFGMAEGGVPGISTRGSGATFQVRFDFDQTTVEKTKRNK